MNPPRRSAPWPALRVAVRLARRETTRRPWRTLLVALLVAVPVAGMMIAAVWVRTENRSAIDRWRANFGNVDLFVAEGPTAATTAPVDEMLPAGTRVVRYRSEYSRVLTTTDGVRSRVEVSDLPMVDPLVEPMMQVTSGRAPTAAGEVFLTRAVAKKLGVGVGDTLSLERPKRVDWTVVGVGESRNGWGQSSAIVGPGTDWMWRGTELTASKLLIDLPDTTTSAELLELSRQSENVLLAPGLLPPNLAPVTYEDSSVTSKVRWTWVIGAVVLTVVGIVISAAFAAGARRQLTTLGQLSANGASPRVLRRVLFLQGTWTGVIGAVLGLGLAGAILAALAPHADRLFQLDVDPYSIRLSDLVPIVVLAVAASTVAALVPARTTARIPILAALAGRRPLRPVPAWLTVTGVAMVAFGLAFLGLAVLGANAASGANENGTVWALAAITGGIAVLLGACAVAPGYVSVLEPMARRFHGAWRLAARSLARQRTRTGAVVSAVCATSALAIVASALVLSADARDRNQEAWIRPDQIQLGGTAYDVRSDGTTVDTATPVGVPQRVMAAVLAVVPNSKTHHIVAAVVPDASTYQRWEVRDFVSDQPSATPEGGNLVLLDYGTRPAAIVDDELLDLYGLPSAARDVLLRDGIIGINSASVSGSATAALMAESDADEATGRPATTREVVPPVEFAIVTAEKMAIGQLPRVLVTPAKARALGLEAAAGLTVITAPRALSDSQRNAVQSAADDYNEEALDASDPGEHVVVNVSLFYPTSGLDPRLLQALLTSAALLLSLFVVAASLAPAAAETRDERDVLVVVGAPPSTMRGTSGRKALLLAMLGAVLAVPVGFLPASVFTAASKDDLPFVFPWLVVALLVIAVPIVAYVTATLFSGIALRLKPVRVSTMTFD